MDGHKRELIKKYRLVTVEWLDAESDNTWGEVEEVEKWAQDDCTIYDIGWLVSVTKRYIVITNQLTYDGVFGNRTKIPRDWIKKIYYVDIKRVAKAKIKVGMKK
jgi:hypothetical protein